MTPFGGGIIYLYSEGEHIAFSDGKLGSAAIFGYPNGLLFLRIAHLIISRIIFNGLRNFPARLVNVNMAKRP